MSDLERGVQLVLEGGKTFDDSVKEIINSDDVKVQLHQLHSTHGKTPLSTVLLCISRYLYDRDEKVAALTVLEVFAENGHTHTEVYRRLKERILLELGEHKEYLLYSNEPWNCCLIHSFNDGDLALKYLLDWKKISPTDSRISLAFLYLNKFNEAKLELEMTNQTTKEGLENICLCYLHMQWPHLALPYLTKLHLLDNDVNTKFMSFLERCRCLIFLNKTTEAFSLLQEGQVAFQLTAENELWMNLTIAFAYLSSHQVTKFYREVSKILRHLHSYDDISPDMELNLLEMLSIYFFVINQYQKALQTAQTLLKTQLARNDDHRYDHHIITAYGIIGKVFIVTEEFTLAEMTFQRCLEKIEGTGSPTLMINTLSDLVRLYKIVRNDDLRHYYLKEELEILTRYDGSESIYFEWRVRLDYGIYLQDEGQYEDAEVELEKALAIVQELHLVVEEAEILYIVSDICQELGETQKGYYRLKQSLGIWKELPYTEKTDTVTLRLLECMEVLGMTSEAKTLAKSLAKNSHNKKLKVNAAIILARILMKEKGYDEVLPILDKAKKEAKRHGLAKELGHIYGLLGEFYFCVNNRKMAISNFCKQVNYFDFLKDPQGQTDTLKYIIMHKMIKNDIPGAVKVIKMRVTTAEKGSPLLYLKILDESIVTLLQMDMEEEVIVLLDKKADLILNNDIPSSSDDVIGLISQLKSLNLTYKAQTFLSTYLNQNLELCDERHFLELAALLSDYDRQLSVDLLESVIATEHFNIKFVNRLLYLYMQLGMDDKAVDLFREMTKLGIHLEFFDVLTMSFVEGNIERKQCVEMALQLNASDQLQFLDTFNLYGDISHETSSLLSTEGQIHWSLYHGNLVDIDITMVKENVLAAALRGDDSIRFLTETLFNNDDFDLITTVLMISSSKDLFRSIYCSESRRQLKMRMELSKIGRKYECPDMKKEEVESVLSKYSHFTYIYQCNDYKLFWEKSEDNERLCFLKTSPRESFWNHMVNRLVDQYNVVKSTKEYYYETLRKSTHLYGDCLDQKTSAHKSYFVVPRSKQESDISHDCSVVMVGKRFEEYQTKPGFIHLSTQEDVFQTVDQVKAINKASILLVDPMELNPIFLLQTEARPKILVLAGTTWSHLPLWPIILDSVGVLAIYKNFDELQSEMMDILQGHLNSTTDIDTNLIRKLETTCPNGIFNIVDDNLEIKCKAVTLRNSLRQAVSNNSTSSWLSKHREICPVSPDKLLQYLEQCPETLLDAIRNSEEPQRTNLQHLYWDYCITNPIMEREICSITQKRRYRSRRKKARRRSGISSMYSSRSSVNSDVCLLSEGDVSDSESISKARVISVGME